MADEILDALVELMLFLPNPDPEIRLVTIEAYASHSTTPEGREALKQIPGLYPKALTLTGDITPISKQAYSLLVNISQDDDVSLALVKTPGMIDRLVESIFDKENLLVELPCMVLANLTRSSEGCARLLQVDDPLQGLHVCRLLDRFISDERRSKPLSWIGLILTNITQMDQGRALLLDPKRRIMPALLSQITHDDVIRRRGVLGAIRNCCFSESDHEYLVFSPDIDIITQVLKQLVGPEPLDERYKDDIPDVIKQLNTPQRIREPDAYCRKLLIECLFLLTTKRKFREMMRKICVYPVIRAMDEVEPEEEVKEEIVKLLEHILPDEVDDEQQHRELATRSAITATSATSAPVTFLPQQTTSTTTTSTSSTKAASSTLAVSDDDAGNLAIGALVDDDDDDVATTTTTTPSSSEALSK